MTNPIDGSFNKNQINQTTNKVNNNTGHPDTNKTSISKEAVDHKRPPPSDQVVLTPFSQKIQQLEKSLASQPEIDTAKVDRVKQAIADGKYTINPDEIANKLIEIEKLLK